MKAFTNACEDADVLKTVVFVLTVVLELVCGMGVGVFY